MTLCICVIVMPLMHSDSLRVAPLVPLFISGCAKDPRRLFLVSFASGELSSDVARLHLVPAAAVFRRV